MIEYVYYTSAIGVVLLCYLAAETKDLLQASVYLGASGLLLALIYFILKAPDIAITEAAVSALAFAILVFTIGKTRRAE